jgi:hypothetical protein
MSIALLDSAPASIPSWIASAFNSLPGLDPLGLQSITIDRMMPALMPGILALSRRARYFSYYPFLIKEHAAYFRNATQSELSGFIKRREYELSLAVALCAHCGTSATGAIGSSRSGPEVLTGHQVFERQESVESFLGGYGLYYRSPIRDLGLIAAKGEFVSELNEPLPRDVLRPGRSENLALAYREAIANTHYYREYFFGSQPIPRGVLEELSHFGCLCRLDDFPGEQELIKGALFDLPDGLTPPLGGYHSLTARRRQSFALLLWILGSGEVREARGVRLEERFRRQVWGLDTKHLSECTVRAKILASWAAVTARDYMEAALVSIFHDVCQQGLAYQSIDGMTDEELSILLRETIVEGTTVELRGQVVRPHYEMPTHEFIARACEIAHDLDLESIRIELVKSGSAVGGLTLLVLLIDRLGEPITGRPEWRETASASSTWQPGLSSLMDQVRSHYDLDPLLGETLEFITRRFVLAIHERNAYSKLPNFTFRFRWQNDHLKFYADHADHTRTNLPDTRVGAVATLGVDLGLLALDGGQLTLTPEGWAFLGSVLE